MLPTPSSIVAAVAVAVVVAEKAEAKKDRRLFVGADEESSSITIASFNDDTNQEARVLPDSVEVADAADGDSRRKASIGVVVSINTSVTTATASTPTVPKYEIPFDDNDVDRTGCFR